MGRALLAPLFGLAIASIYAASWLTLERAFTARTAAAMVYLGFAGSLSAATSLMAMHVLRRRRWTARLAAALLLLTGGTIGLTALFLAIRLAWVSHPLADLPFRAALMVVGIIGTATLYNLLAAAGFLLFPLGAPVILLFALLIARSPR